MNEATAAAGEPWLARLANFMITHPSIILPTKELPEKNDTEREKSISRQRKELTEPVRGRKIGGGRGGFWLVNRERVYNKRREGN